MTHNPWTPPDQPATKPPLPSTGPAGWTALISAAVTLSLFFNLTTWADTLFGFGFAETFAFFLLVVIPVTAVGAIVSLTAVGRVAWIMWARR